jgi:hypothetical protein
MYTLYKKFLFVHHSSTLCVYSSGEPIILDHQDDELAPPPYDDEMRVGACICYKMYAVICLKNIDKHSLYVF